MTLRGTARVGSHGAFPQSELNALNVNYRVCAGPGEQRAGLQGSV